MNTQSVHSTPSPHAHAGHASSHAHPASAQARGLAVHARMVAALRESLQSAGVAVAVLDTHISTVIVAGPDAYKIKKPVALPFLDFSTRAARRRFCRAEVRLNRRFAPELYQGVVPITGTSARPRIGGGRPVIDHAVHMRAFAQEDLAAARLDHGLLSIDDVDRLASAVAGFHASARQAGPHSRHGTPKGVLVRALANATEMLGGALSQEAATLVRSLQEWMPQEHARLRPALRARHAHGCVRECHGDLHLGNVVFQDGAPRLFDCIEFNADLRWIDVMSDVAFLMMDLAARGRADLASRFLNEYLEHSGDYDGLAVLRFYVVYRAMVRAKVACFRLQEVRGSDARARAEGELLRYLRLAVSYTERHGPALVITCGPAASGKSTFAAAFAAATAAIRIRTDVERKRLAHLPRNARTASAYAADLYAPAMTRATYARVADLARSTLAAGMITVVDGTFLAHWQRQLLRAVAREAVGAAGDAGAVSARPGVPFAIACSNAPPAVLRERLVARAAAGESVSEATLQVLERQLASAEPLDAEEAAAAVSIDTATPAGGDAPAGCTKLLAKLGSCRPPAEAPHATTRAIRRPAGRRGGAPAAGARRRQARCARVA